MRSAPHKRLSAAMRGLQTSRTKRFGAAPITWAQVAAALRAASLQGPQYAAPTAWSQPAKLLWYVAALQRAATPVSAWAAQSSA